MFITDNPFFLAPLAGITDAVMRELCSLMGASLTYTEMVSAKGIYYEDAKTERLLFIPKGAKKTAIQIFGSDPRIMGIAAYKLNGLNNFSIDINMGCPAPKIVKNGDGAALMKDPDLIYKIVLEVVSNTDKPVTVKIRKGWDSDSVNACEAARAAEDAGARAIAVHGRTREQFYSGDADWDIIRQVKEASNIPVIGNGDIKSPNDAFSMMRKTGCDYVMIGRAALGNPWIFRELTALQNGIEPTKPTDDERFDVMKRHLEGLIELKGDYVAVREMRKHIAWYIKGMKNAARIRCLVNRIEDVDEMRELINARFKIF